MNWEDLKLSAENLELVKKSGYDRPTPVQEETIPLVLEGRDVIASAQTGTGKTASFVLPMVDKLVGRQGTYGLILGPTREIAQQIQATLELFGVPRGVRSIVLIGGVDYRFDDQALATYPHIIVATPGRLCDHLDRGNIWLEFLEFVVLDEADRMLDMGFSDQLSRIMQEVPAKRQTMLFSATFPPAVEKLARKILIDPARVAIGKPQSTATSVEQRFIWLEEAGKMSELRRLIQNEKGSMIIFTRSKDGATRVWRSLHSSGIYDATYIHSDRMQSHREQALAEFKEGKYRILVATDVAGRGIHVDDVAQVVNYDLPMEAEDYIHRIGRTGRAGASGKATTFITHRDRSVIRQLEKLLGREITNPRESGEPGRTVAARTGPAPQSRPAAQEHRSREPRARSSKGFGQGSQMERSRAGTAGKTADPAVKRGPVAPRTVAGSGHAVDRERPVQALPAEGTEPGSEPVRAMGHAGNPVGRELRAADQHTDDVQNQGSDPESGDERGPGEGGSVDEGGKGRRRKRKRRKTPGAPKGNTPAFPV